MRRGTKPHTTRKQSTPCGDVVSQVPKSHVSTHALASPLSHTHARMHTCAHAHMHTCTRTFDTAQIVLDSFIVAAWKTPAPAQED